MESIKILSFGELLWDKIQGKAYIGGAPFNLAIHLAKMGVHSAYISTLGRDSLGKKALNIARQYQLDTRYITFHPRFPTGTVDVKLRSGGQPDYVIHEHTAWDHIILQEKEIKDILAQQWQAFCFGTLAQRTEDNRQLLYRLLSHLDCDHFFYDVNLRQAYYQKEWIEHSLQRTSLLKLNETEVDVLAQLLLGEAYSLKAFCRAMQERYRLQVICITRGEKGSLVYENETFYESPGEKVHVIDTVGAGDSYAAGFLLAFLSGIATSRSAVFAGQVGSFVASQPGAVPLYSREIKAKIKAIHDKRN